MPILDRLAIGDVRPDDMQWLYERTIELLAACEMALELMPTDARMPPKKYVDCREALKSAIAKTKNAKANPT